MEQRTIAEPRLSLDRLELLNRLDVCIARQAGSRIRRTLKNPLPMLYSKIWENYCRFFGQTKNFKAKLFWGMEMQVVFPEIVSCFILRYGFFEPELTKIFIRMVNEGDTVFDIGTHFGYYSLLASRLVGPNGHVHSFEPTRHTHRVVAMNVDLESNVTLNNLAVWSDCKVLQFKDYGVTMSAFNSLYEAKLRETSSEVINFEEYEVMATSVDQYIHQTGTRPNFIKIDAENAEYDIILGMKETLSKVRPAITLEVGDVNTGKHKSSAEAVRLLIGHGYEVYEWRQNELKRHVVRSEYEHENLLFIPM